MRVPLLDVKRQNERLLPDLRRAFDRVMVSGQFILGPEVEELERQVAEIAGARFGIGVSSGTDAILLALMALGIGPGDEVLCPSFTFFATAGCVARTGARPVFVDSCQDSFNIDVRSARAQITSRTKAIVPVHLFGQMADMDAVMELARGHNLLVIEDAAQALGAGYRGRPAGSIGDFGTFSFYPSKNLGGFGDAGMLVTNDAKLADKAKVLRTHGAEQRYFHKWVGANFRIDALQAALLNVKINYLDEYTERRGANAAYYSSKFKHISASGVTLPVAAPDMKHIWNQYTIQVRSGRDALREFLAKRQIGSEIYYPLPLHLQECFPPPEGVRPSLPVCETLARQCVSLPVYAELSREELDTVSDAILAFFEQNPPSV